MHLALGYFRILFIDVLIVVVNVVIIIIVICLSPCLDLSYFLHALKNKYLIFKKNKQ